MTHARQNFIAWLRNAHAMEEHAVTLMAAQVRRIESYPDLRERMQQHLNETRRHADRLQGLLDWFSGGGSTIKDMTARLTAAAQGMGGMLISDEVVRSAIAAYAFEHTEIATYRVLIAAADELEEDEARTVFEDILAEEVAMAEWLERHMDALTRVFLMRDERDLQAKR